MATNEHGSASCSAEVLVNEAFAMPEFKEKMKHITVTEGDTARFDVHVIGNPKPQTEWSKGGKPIREGERFKIVQSDDSDLYSLLIENVLMDDFGSYKCVASNEAGRMQCSARLDVKERETAPEISDEYGDAPIEVNEGDELKLNVTVQGKPRPDVKWFKDDKPLKRTSRMSLSTRGNKFGVTIFSVLPEDSGVYKCVANSTVGTTAKTFQVNIEGNSFFLCVTLILCMKLKQNTYRFISYMVACYSFRSRLAHIETAPPLKQNLPDMMGDSGCSQIRSRFACNSCCILSLYMSRILHRQNTKKTSK